MCHINKTNLMNVTCLKNTEITDTIFPRNEHLGRVRPSYIGSGTSCAKDSPVGSSIASGMAAAIKTGHPRSNWKDETQGCGHRPSTWELHPVLNFEK